MDDLEPRTIWAVTALLVVAILGSTSLRLRSAPAPDTAPPSSSLSDSVSSDPDGGQAVAENDAYSIGGPFRHSYRSGENDRPTRANWANSGAVAVHTLAAAVDTTPDLDAYPAPEIDASRDLTTGNETDDNPPGEQVTTVSYWPVATDDVEVQPAEAVYPRILYGGDTHINADGSIYVSLRSTDNGAVQWLTAQPGMPPSDIDSVLTNNAQPGVLEAVTDLLSTSDGPAEGMPVQVNYGLTPDGVVVLGEMPVQVNDELPLDGELNSVIPGDVEPPPSENVLLRRLIELSEEGDSSPVVNTADPVLVYTRAQEVAEDAIQEWYREND